MRRVLVLAPVLALAGPLPARAQTSTTDDTRTICECRCPPPAPQATQRSAPLPPTATPPARRATDDVYGDGPRPFGPAPTVEPSTPGLPVPNP